MKLDGFKVLAPGPREHGEQVFDLFAKTFSQPGYFKMLRRAREQYIGGSHYDWNASRIGVIGDQVITHFGVWDYQMRIGSARVKRRFSKSETARSKSRRRAPPNTPSKAETRSPNCSSGPTSHWTSPIHTASNSKATPAR